jgi:hypothetical protein
MFGLESGKKSNKQEFFFDLENDLKDSKKRKELQGKVESRILEVKKFLYEGASKEQFDQFGLLLQAYEALLKVISRVKT